MRISALTGVTAAVLPAFPLAVLLAGGPAGPVAADVATPSPVAAGVPGIVPSPAGPVVAGVPAATPRPVVAGTGLPSADAPLDAPPDALPGDQEEELEVGQGKICINVPVDAIARAWARIVAPGLVVSRAAGAAPRVGVPTPPQPTPPQPTPPQPTPPQPTPPQPTPPQPAVTPVVTPGVTPALRFPGGGLPKAMPFLEAVPC
ncbi:hypothetical protein [Nonomuraea sp. KM88]|uniref:hypothetical protein n=1 Tax=Nonomuraea sp. KM88 TaxID=3457427 RepID=UPI003FCE2EDB